MLEKQKTANIDAALALGGSINGTVTSQNTGDPLQDICVTVYDTAFGWIADGFTDPLGAYSIGALPAGDYKVEFRDCSGSDAHIGEWYNDEADFDNADLVTAVEKQKTANIDAALTLGGLLRSSSRMWCTSGLLPRSSTLALPSPSLLAEKMRCGM